MISLFIYSGRRKYTGVKIFNVTGTLVEDTSMKLVTTYKSVGYSGSMTLPMTTKFSDVRIQTYNSSGSNSGNYIGLDNVTSSYIDITPSSTGVTVSSSSSGTKFTIYYSYWE